MASALITNNAATTLSSAITTTGQSTMVVVDASKFPTPSGGDYFYCTLLDTSNIPEIVKVTAVAGTTFTISRGQDGTTARTFTSGATVRLALTVAVMAEFAKLALSAQKAGDTYTGTHNFSGATAVSLPAGTSVGNVSAAEMAYLDGVTSALQGQIDAKANAANAALTGVPTAPTAAYGTNTTQLATTAFVTNAALTTAIPTSPADAGKLASSDGVTVSFTMPPAIAIFNQINYGGF